MAGLTELEGEFKIDFTTGVKHAYKLKREGEQIEITRTITLAGGASERTVTTVQNMQVDAHLLSKAAEHFKYLADAKFA